MQPVTHPHVNPHVPLPGAMTLFFAGQTVCYLPVWAWALMDTTVLYASDRGWSDVKTQKTAAWAATVGLGKGLVFLHERGWRGTLTIKGHCRDVGIFGSGGADPLIARCKELLTGIRWTAEVVTWEENHFADMLCHEAATEWRKK